MIDDELLRIVGEYLGVSVAYRSRPARISGGFWASIHGFEVVGGPGDWQGQLVLRVMPDTVAENRETVIQRAVAEQRFPTPVVLAAGFDEGIGGAFMIMPRATGSSPMSGLALGPSLVHLPALLRELPRQLADVAVALHALDSFAVRAAVSASAPDADPGGGPGVERRLASVRSVAAPASGFVEVADWLQRHRPGALAQPDSHVVCHGDLHPFNVLVDDVGNVTVLDWTDANLLPREFDVGFTAGLLRCAPISVPAPLRPALRRITDRLARAFVERYASAAPLDLTMVAWFEVLQYGRCLAEVARTRAGLVAGTPVGTTHPFETSAVAMIRRLAELTGVTVMLPQRPVPTG